MMNLLKKLRFFPRGLVIFIITGVFLLVLSVVQVNCPICAKLTENSSGSVKVLEVKSEIVEYKLNHGKCADAYMELICEVDILLKNEDLESVLSLAVIKGGVHEEALVNENVKFIQTEIPGKETKQVQETISLFIWGLNTNMMTDISELAKIPEVEFSVITDPEILRANCPVCGEAEKLPFTGWVKLIFQ